MDETKKYLGFLIDRHVSIVAYQKDVSVNSLSSVCDVTIFSP